LWRRAMPRDRRNRTALDNKKTKCEAGIGDANRPGDRTRRSEQK
jgi:hypothetical protein